MHHGLIALSYSHHKRATTQLVTLLTAALWLLALLRRRRRDPPSPTPLSALPLAFALLSPSTVTPPGSHRTILITRTGPRPEYSYVGTTSSLASVTA